MGQDTAGCSAVFGLACNLPGPVCAGADVALQGWRCALDVSSPGLARL